MKSKKFPKKLHKKTSKNIDFKEKSVYSNSENSEDKQITKSSKNQHYSLNSGRNHKVLSSEEKKLQDGEIELTGINVNQNRYNEDCGIDLNETGAINRN